MLGNEIDAGVQVRRCKRHSRHGLASTACSALERAGRRITPSILIDGPGIVVGRKGSAGALAFSAERVLARSTTTYYVVDKGDHNWRSSVLPARARCGLTRLNSHSAVPWPDTVERRFLDPCPDAASATYQDADRDRVL